MNENLQNEIAKYLDKLNSGSDYLAQEAPGLIQEYLSWQLSSRYIGITFSLVFILATILISVFLKFKFNHLDVTEQHKRDANSLLIIVVAALSTVPVIYVFVSLYTIVQINVAPRVFLIENLISLTR